MKNVTYYNAGAGCGKTYTLITEIVDLIRNNRVKPNELILTTFTEKAATEFREKVKARLYSHGMTDAALQIDNALIGTVHSVCKQMIDKYWYLLGVSPNMGVMDDDSKYIYISQSLGDLPTPEEYQILNDFAFNIEIPKNVNNRKYGVDENIWHKHLESIIGYATNYELTDFSRSKAKSLEFIQQFVNTEIGNVDISDDELDKMLNEAFNYVSNSNRIKKKDDYYTKFNTIREKRNNKTIAWRKDVAKVLESKYGPTCDSVGTRLGDIWQSNEVYEIQKKYINTIFTLASRWQEKYARFKREKNLIDYNDMELFMNRLLQNETARADMSQSYQYLFVDEFQDSSPIQIKLFTALSELVKHSYWVGDYKQAIYGFRGTDIDQVKAVIDNIDDVETLDTCYRSLPPIIDFNNHLFSKLFQGELQSEEICLKQHQPDSSQKNSLCYCISEDKKDVMPYSVKKLLDEGVSPKKIAILARDNGTLKKIANNLRKRNIASCLGQNKLNETQTWALVESLLNIVDNKHNMLARAQVALLTDLRYGTKQIIETRLSHLQDDNKDDYLSDVPLVKNTLILSDILHTQSVATLVEQLIVQLGLPQVVKQVEDDSMAGVDCLQTIISYAKKYEEYCLQLNTPPNIVGFIQYFVMCFDNDSKTASFGNPEGVQLFTYHGSKGLEWEYVFLTSLDNTIESDYKFIKRNIYGVYFERSETPTPQNPNPEVYIRLAPWIYGGDEKVPPAIDVILRESHTYKNKVKSVQAEERRLLYVGMTRARDVLTLAINRRNDRPNLTLFHELGYNGVDLNVPENKKWDIFSTGDMFINITPTETEIEQQDDDTLVKEKMIKLPEFTISTQQAERRYISPSSVHGAAIIGAVHNFNNRIPVKGNTDMVEVGNCIHHIFASIEEHHANSNTYIRDIIRSFGLETVLSDHDSIITAWKNLTSHLATTYGVAVHTWHERPFRMERDGQTLVGSIDLVWQTTEGDLLIDYKTCPMGESAIAKPASEHFVGNYGGQISTYRNALEAAGEHLLKCLVYYPVSGLLVELIL